VRATPHGPSPCRWISTAGTKVAEAGLLAEA